jgi:ubiquinone/menaquinone biosynthesis C-methylase UbiE
VRSHDSRVSFRMIRLVHETLYGWFRNPSKALSAAGLEPGQRVLEVGCGPGFFTLPAASIVGASGRVVAVDVNPHAVEHVRAKAAAAGAANIDVLLEDASDASLAADPFDLVFVFGLPRAAGGFEKLWEGIHRALKPGGILAVEGRTRPPQGTFGPAGEQGRIRRYRRIP